MGDELTVVKLTEIFLVSGSILVGGLGVARTEGLKTGISTLGLLSTLVWAFCNWDACQAESLHSHRKLVLAWLPLLFFFAWCISGYIHFNKWRDQHRAQKAARCPCCEKII
jgi:hypothetical protein